MKRMTGGAALVAVAMTLAPLAVSAQAGERGPRGMMGMRGRDMGPGGGGVEMLMRMRDRLELTEDQIQALDEIRAQQVERRTAHQAQMAELHSRVQAGEVDISELREAVEARREAARAMREAQRERVEAVLTDGQKETLQELGHRARTFERGRRAGMRQGARSAMRHGARGSMMGRRQGALRGGRGGAMMRGGRDVPRGGRPAMTRRGRRPAFGPLPCPCRGGPPGGDAEPDTLPELPPGG